MTYALFLGCTIPARSRNYELSARKVAGKLGIELVDLENFICCGFPIKSAELKSSMVLGAYNLALAQQKHLMQLLHICPDRDRASIGGRRGFKKDGQ
jgi:heterodisulfide reductase subunit B